MANIFTDYIDTQGELPARTQKSMIWFRDQAQKFRNINTQKLISLSKDNFKSQVVIGRMYLFAYDPKHKATLPYYDRFPLIFPFDRDSNGFTGINLHYLPVQLRARLMDALYELVSDDNYDSNTRLRLNYNILHSLSRIKYFKPCVKRYLNNQVDSRFILIEPSEWQSALFLPLQQFRKAKVSEVYAHSRKIING
jgi:hypothetical protein